MISPSKLLNGVGCSALAHAEREKGIRWSLAVGDSNYVIGIEFLFFSFFCKDWLTHKEREQWDYFVIGLGYRYLQLD